ncbi:MAG: SLC13 family permease, partial [Bacillota bacterium]
MTIAVAIFSVTYLTLISERIPRHWVALSGALSLTVFGVMSMEEAIASVSWETMGLLFGMFCILTVLSEAGVFRQLALTTAKVVDYQPIRLFIIFPLLAAGLAAFMDSITVLLFLASLTIQIGELMEMDVVPLVIAEVCAANLGGAATLVGDPPNVILGTMLGFGFNDFALHTGPIALVGVVITVLFFLLVNYRKLRSIPPLAAHQRERIENSQGITDRRLAKLGIGALVTAVLLLITHNYVKRYLGVDISVAGAALLPALILLMLDGKRTDFVLQKIDWESLLFFGGLFVIIGGLEKTGAIRSLTEMLVGSVRDNPRLLLSGMLWGSGFISAIIDNVPFALTMAYVLQEMTTMVGVPALSIMVWSLAVGVDAGGSMTPIGASANVVAYSAME